MPARKRSAPESVASRRRSNRLSSTPHKSYLHDENDERLPSKRRGRPPIRQSLPQEDSVEREHEEETAEEDDWEAEKEDEGGDDDDEDDEDAPPKVVIIPLEKMRDDGGVSYEDHRLHRNTLLFLKDLKANNKRSWLKAHDDEYRRALKDWQSFVEAATQTMMQVDETIPELPTKDVIFRIHRDIRFSKDPTPYKPHFSVAWSRTGRKGPYACYYLHCEPGSSFFGGGLWHPEAQPVAKLRRSIDRHPERWRRALNDPLLRKSFFPAVKADAGPEAAVRAFVGKNQDNALKKRPKGYQVTHRDIELLKLRNFTVSKPIDAEMLCRDDALQSVADAMRALLALVSFLNSVVMPDPNLDDDSESSSDEAEEEEQDHQA
ncbi:hypothetical protein XA68_17578 [Ophiocordyceps unilateralis]|uniref:DUF2461 domain-containing protein n=1 Tax=Ophiocordyceps unilateralis TaxID=268505 RepID=A0A2A9P4M1_OPHUN|nr:hypothetical protein XA68_17578 [Ophiocordyceps unilateralis]